MGDSISGNSEKLLQRGRREGQYICDFGEGGVDVIKHIFFCRRALLVTRSRFTVKDFSAFLDMKIQELGL